MWAYISPWKPKILHAKSQPQMTFLVQLVSVELSFGRVVFVLSCRLLKLILVDQSWLSCRLVELSHIQFIYVSIFQRIITALPSCHPKPPPPPPPPPPPCNEFMFRALFVLLYAPGRHPSAEKERQMKNASYPRRTAYTVRKLAHMHLMLDCVSAVSIMLFTDNPIFPLCNVPYIN
jgi:hypothetical protein